MRITCHVFSTNQNYSVCHKGSTVLVIIGVVWGLMPLVGHPGQTGHSWRTRQWGSKHLHDIKIIIDSVLVQPDMRYQPFPPSARPRVGAHWWVPAECTPIGPVWKIEPVRVNLASGEVTLRKRSQYDPDGQIGKGRGSLGFSARGCCPCDLISDKRQKTVEWMDW